MSPKLIAFTISLLAFVCCQDIVLANKYHLVVRNNIARMAFRPRAASMQQQKECQDYYNPILLEINADYWLDSADCIQTADTQKQDVQDKQAAVRQQVEDLSNQVCQSLTECQQNKDNLVFFNCTKTAGTNGNPTLIDIVGRSAQAETNILSAYQLIESDLSNCQSKCFQKYQTNWNANSNEMNKCINGLATVPPPTTTTPGTTTEAITTDAPTTDAPTNAPTDAPTEAPTEAPTDAPTDAPTTAPSQDSFRL